MAVQLSAPPLEAGDRLDRAEFHRRYKATPEIQRAELVRGIVYVPSPLGHTHHGRPHHLIGTWLGNYVVATPGIISGDNTTVFLGEDNELQPDLFASIETSKGGGSRITSKHYVEGPPELVIEVASSSASYDLHAKRDAYEHHGVQEYLVWRTHDGIIDWWELVEGRYSPLPADADGHIASRVLPGLVLDVSSILAGDWASVLETQRAQFDRAAHTKFAKVLSGRPDQRGPSQGK